MCALLFCLTKGTERLLSQWFLHQAIQELYLQEPQRLYISEGFKLDFMAFMNFTSCQSTLKCWKKVWWSRGDRWHKGRKEHREHSNCKEVNDPRGKSQKFMRCCVNFYLNSNLEKEGTAIAFLVSGLSSECYLYTRNWIFHLLFLKHIFQ